MSVIRRYRKLEHTADIRLRIFGRSLKGLFQNAVFALTDTLVDARRVRKSASRRIDLKGDHEEELLVSLLREVLFLFDARGFVTRRLEWLSLRPPTLKARVWGEKFSPRRHPPRTEIKAVTYHGLKVGKVRGQWVAEVVFDV